MYAVKRKKKQTAGKVAALLLIFLSIMLLGFGVWVFWQEAVSGGTAETVARQYQVDGLDPAAKTGAMPGTNVRERPQGENLFGYRINRVPTFSSAGKGEILLDNPSFNKYLLVLEITQVQNPALLFQSQYIAPNQYIETITLDSVPPPGTYDAMAYLNLVDPETMRVADILECPLTLTVK